MDRKRVTLRVKGSGGDTDAPTVQDFLGQLHDFFGILKGVEEAIAPDGKSAIDWRIVDASVNSPIRIAAEAFPHQFGTSIDSRVNVVVKSVAEGMRQIAVSDYRYAGFTDSVLQRAETFFERVTNGIAETIIEFGADELPLDIDRDFARAAERKIAGILNPSPKAYRELGSVEGFFKAVERDGHNRPLVWIRHRISGADVKCIVANESLRKRLASESIGEIWDQRRLLVTGIIYFKALGKIDHVDANDFRLLRRRDELPSLEDILDATFANGMRTEDYLEKLRNGEIH